MNGSFSTFFQEAIIPEGWLHHPDAGFEVYFTGGLFGSTPGEVDPSEKNPARRVAGLFQQAGISGMSHLDGTFLILILTPDCLYAVRDRHGTGPSFYYTTELFATSLEELTGRAPSAFEPDPGAISAYLRSGYVPVPRTAFKNISKLAAGHYLVIKRENGSPATHTLYPFSSFNRPISNLSLEELSEQYGALHRKAIKKRIEGHKSVGILLSGGYDSGSNLVALRDMWQGDIHSYSVGFKGNYWSELPTAKEMSEIFDTKHQTFELDGSEIRFLPEIVRTLGDPFIEAGVMVNYAAMKMVSENRPDMILGGDGSDQYFGTSGREVALHVLTRKTALNYPMKWLANLLDTRFVEQGGYPYRVRFHLKRITDIMGGDQFGFTDRQIRSFMQTTKKTDSYRFPWPVCQGFDQLYHLHHYECDIAKTIDQVILYKASKMAEAFGNRLSYPYLDNELYDFLKTVPIHYKCKGDHLYALARGRGIAKFLLKHHYKPFLPLSVTGKKKQGGFAPLSIFFEEEKQRAYLSAFILESDLCRLLFDRKAIARWLGAFEANAGREGEWFWYQQAQSFQFFNLLTLAIWWELFVSNKPVSLQP